MFPKITEGGISCTSTIPSAIDEYKKYQTVVFCGRSAPPMKQVAWEICQTMLTNDDNNMVYISYRAAGIMMM